MLCVSLESPHRSDSTEYTQCTIFNIKRTITINYPKSAAVGFFKGLKNEFEPAVVNEPSVFGRLKFYCIEHDMTSTRKQIMTDVTTRVNTDILWLTSHQT